MLETGGEKAVKQESEGNKIVCISFPCLSYSKQHHSTKSNWLPATKFGCGIFDG
jgi:hypothetical protein